MASFAATRPSAANVHAQVSAPVQSLRTGTVHQVVGGQLVSVYNHHPITPSVIEDHWAAMSNPSRAFRRYIVSMDDGLAIMAPTPVATSVPVPTTEPPVVNRWYLETFGARRYYEQEVPKTARRQGPKKQEVAKPASLRVRVLQLNAQSQAKAAQQPFTLLPGAIQVHLEDQEVLKPAPFPTPFVGQWPDFDQYQSAHSMQAAAYRQYLEQDALKSAPFSISALAAAQQQVPVQSAHSMQAEAYPNPAYGQLFKQPAPQAVAQEQEVLKPAPFQALVNDQMLEGGMEYNVAHPTTVDPLPPPISGFDDFVTLSENQWTVATLENPEKVVIDLTEEEEERAQVPVDLRQVETEDEWVIIDPSQETVDEVRRAENTKLTERKKELSRVLHSGAARRWYNSFVAAPNGYQRAYCNQYWGSDKLALDDVKDLIQYFDDFNATRLHRLSHEAMVKNPPLVSDQNGGERPMTRDEILQAISQDLQNLRTLKRQAIMSQFEPTTSKRKRSKAAKEPQPEQPAKKRKKARKPKTLPTPPLENSDADAQGVDDDEDLIAPEALPTPAPESTEIDSGLGPQADQYENDRALEEWKRLNPNWAAEDSDSDEEEEEMACNGASSSEESEEE